MYIFYLKKVYLQLKHKQTSTSVCYLQYDKEQENDVVIRIKDLKVWTPEEKSWWRRKPTKSKTVILNNGS